MVLDPALGIRSTIAWVAANSIYTRLVRGTLRVTDAPTNISNWLRRLASSAAAAHVSIRTNADHCT